ASSSWRLAHGPFGIMAHSIGWSGGPLPSYGEDSAALDALLIHDARSHDKPENARYSCTSFVEASGTEQAHRLTSPAWNRMHGESVSPCPGDLDGDDQRSPPAANAASWHL